MRLSKDIAKNLVVTLKSESSLSEIELYLVGSRVDDLKKGGDIDLLWIVPEDYLSQAITKKTDLRVRLAQLAGEQRVDLIIATHKKIASDPFLKTIWKAEKIPLSYL